MPYFLKFRPYNSPAHPHLFVSYRYNANSEEMVSNEGISKWFPLSELTSLEMPFTSKYVIEHYLNTGHKTDMIYVGVADGAKVIFTGMPEFYEKFICLFAVSHSVAASSLFPFLQCLIPLEVHAIRRLWHHSIRIPRNV